jgi:hypothetical protein
MTQYLALLGLLFLAGISSAQGYTFRTIDVGFPGATDTVVTGLSAQQVLVGIYADRRGQTQGFERRRGQAVVPLLNVIPQAILNNGAVLGEYRAPTGHTEGFVFAQGTFTPIVGAVGQEMPELVEALGANEAGVVVGTYRSSDGQFHGFRYDIPTAAFTTVDVPGGRDTLLLGINGGGVLVAEYTAPDNTRHAVRVDSGGVTDVTVPGLEDLALVGLTDSGKIAGNAGVVGFVVDGGTAQIIEAPGATLTELFGIRNDGTLYGRFLDSAGVGHGFVATPDGRRTQRASEWRGVRRAFEAGDCSPGSKRWLCRKEGR